MRLGEHLRHEELNPASVVSQPVRQVVTDAGFTRFRRAAETPFNLVYEVRP
jgi:hypothetical protein